MRIFVPIEHLDDEEKLRLDEIRRKIDETESIEEIHELSAEIDNLIGIALGRFKKSKPIDDVVVFPKRMITAVHYCPKVKSGGKEWSTLLGRDEHCPVCGHRELDEHGELLSEL
ncbi:hypothetical protein [Pseudobutyrivibrio sp.]